MKCLNCSKEFEAKRKNTRFCSGLCMKQDQRHKDHPIAVRPANIAVCPVNVTDKPTKIHQVEVDYCRRGKVIPPELVPEWLDTEQFNIINDTKGKSLLRCDGSCCQKIRE